MGLPDVWEELRGQQGRFALVVGEAAAQSLVWLAAAAGSEVLSVGYHLTVTDPDGWSDPESYLQGHPVLSHLEVLFWPDVGVDPLRLLAALARRTPVIAQWPGSVAEGRARFSDPGRRDYYDESLPAVAIVLSARATTFPDQLPYTRERTR